MGGGQVELAGVELGEIGEQGGGRGEVLSDAFGEQTREVAVGEMGPAVGAHESDAFLGAHQVRGHLLSTMRDFGARTSPLDAPRRATRVLRSAMIRFAWVGQLSALSGRVSASQWSRGG